MYPAVTAVLVEVASPTRVLVPGDRPVRVVDLQITSLQYSLILSDR